ncbi:MAG TPA: hypothetical protein VGC69_17425 [Bordetella sp.]
MRHLLFRCGAAAALLAGLSACQNIDRAVKPGDAYAAVLARYGSPKLVCPRPDGGQRAVWTLQPLGQYAWGVNVGADSRVERAEAVLTDEHFKVLDTGDWTPDQVRCEFGPPSEVETVGLGDMREVVWSYRYKEQGVWNAQMHIFMGPKGDHVTHHFHGPDPIYERSRLGFY